MISRPYEMYLLLGCEQISGVHWIGMSLTAKKAQAKFREPSARKRDFFSDEYHFDPDVPHRSSVQKRLSVYNWNPGPQRGKEGAVEKQIAGKWHIITLQESIQYVDHELLRNRFHVLHFTGCAILFNKDTFHPGIETKSIYLYAVRQDLPGKVI